MADRPPGPPSRPPNRPLANRVAPDGAFLAVAERGLLTGNRGCLCPAPFHLGAARWAGKAWISCVLTYKDRPPRRVMQPNTWTELFFLDEATAMAAGHRPCGLCRRAALADFRAGLARGGAGDLAQARVGVLDAALHAERIAHPSRLIHPHAAKIADLPDGAMLAAHDGAPPCLVLGDTLRDWSPGGYGPPQPRPHTGIVAVLTAPILLAALRGGYRPILHPSAET